MTTLLDIPTVRFATSVRRLAAAFLVIASVLAASPQVASASDTSSVSTESDLTCPISLAGALFRAHSVDGGLTWDARFIVDVDAAFFFRGGVLHFAVPLPPGETLVPAGDLSPIEEGGRLVGLRVSPGAIRDRTIDASFFQPVAVSSRAAIPFGAPVAAGDAVQIVDTSVGEARLELDGGEVLERHVSYIGPRAISEGAREEARRLTDVRAHLSTRPIYVRGPDMLATGGLTGHVVDARARARSSAPLAGVLFAGVVGALVLAARKLRHTASVERADAMLASEIDAVAQDGPSPPSPLDREEAS